MVDSLAHRREKALRIAAETQTAELLRVLANQEHAAAADRDQYFREKTELEREVTRLKGYARHKQDCWLKFETRDLVPSTAGFGMRFRQPGDPEPSCTCGLNAHTEGE